MSDLQYVGIEILGILVCVVLIYLELRTIRKDHQTLLDLTAYGKESDYDHGENHTDPHLDA